MKKPDALTRREREIMDILHRRGRATAHEVQGDLAEPPSYSAVRTFLRLLEERGHVRHEQDHGSFVAVGDGRMRAEIRCHALHRHRLQSVQELRTIGLTAHSIETST